MLPKRRVVR